MKRSLVLLLLALTIIAPARVSAAGCKAPQGTSAVDEYCETVPDARGDQGADPGGGAPSISDGAAAALVAQGKDGEALARALGKDPAKLTAKHNARTRVSRGVEVPDVPGSNPFTAVTRAVSGTSTIGSGFFLALFAVVLLMLGGAWVGWRRKPSA